MNETVALNSQELHDYLQKFFSDQHPHKVSDIRDALKLEGKSVSHGQLAGQIYRLTQSGELLNIARGIYQLNSDSIPINEPVPEELVPETLYAEQIRESLLTQLISCRKTLLASISDIKVLDIDEQTFELIRELKNVIKTLQKLETKYQKKTHK